MQNCIFSQSQRCFIIMKKGNNSVRHVVIYRSLSNLVLNNVTKS